MDCRVAGFRLVVSMSVGIFGGNFATRAWAASECYDAAVAFGGPERARIWSRVVTQVPELGPMLYRGGVPYDLFLRPRDAEAVPREFWSRLLHSPSATRAAPETSFLRFSEGPGALLFTPRSDFQVYDARPEPGTFLPLLGPADTAKFVDSLYRETVAAAMSDPRTFSFADPAAGLRPGFEAVPVPGGAYPGAVAIRDRATGEVRFTIAPAGRDGSGAHHLILPLGEPLPVLQADHSSRPADALVLTVRPSLPGHPEVLDIAPFDTATPARVARRLEEEARDWREHFPRAFPPRLDVGDPQLIAARAAIDRAREDLAREHKIHLDNYYKKMDPQDIDVMPVVTMLSVIGGGIAGGLTALNRGYIGDSGSGLLLGAGLGSCVAGACTYGLFEAAAWARAVLRKQSAIRRREHALDAAMRDWVAVNQRPLPPTAQRRPNEAARREWEEQRYTARREPYRPVSGSPLAEYLREHARAMRAPELQRTESLFLRAERLAMTEEQTQELMRRMNGARVDYDEAVRRGDAYLRSLGLEDTNAPLSFARWIAGG